MNSTPMGERAVITLFGRCNVGKSSLINAITGDKVSIVSDIKGTTTDPVKKAMELLPFGPVLFIDTPGLDDKGTLGELRVERSLEYVKYADLIVLVADGAVGILKEEEAFLEEVKNAGKKYIVVGNKSDSIKGDKPFGDIDIYVSALYDRNIDELKELMAKLLSEGKREKTILGDLVKPKDMVLLVTPIDASAPKGRLILPQQQVIREILDRHAVALTVQTEEIPGVLEKVGENISLVICDSQVFNKVSKIIPEDIALTSFSILFANYKGDLKTLYQGARELSRLRDGDRILISEGCTHHRQCEDIGTVKIPGWVREFAKKNPDFKGVKDLEFSFTSGGDFPKELNEYKLVIHCGGCMLNPNQMKSRMDYAKGCEIPITNYGMAIAYMNGILERATKALKIS